MPTRITICGIDRGRDGFTLVFDRSSISQRDTSSEALDQPCFRLKACGCFAMSSSNSMSPRSPLQFQLLSLSVFQLLPPSLLPKLFQPRRLLRVEFPFPLKRGRCGFLLPILRRRFPLIIADRRFRRFLALGQQAVDEDFSKMVLSKGLVLDYRDRPSRPRNPAPAPRGGCGRPR